MREGDIPLSMRPVVELYFPPSYDFAAALQVLMTWLQRARFVHVAVNRFDAFVLYDERTK